MGAAVEPTTEPGKTIYRLGDAAALLGLTHDRATTAEHNEQAVARTLCALVDVIDKHPDWLQSITWLEEAQAVENARQLCVAYDPDYRAPED